jgi:hypothetical protein
MEARTDATNQKLVTGLFCGENFLLSSCIYYFRASHVVARIFPVVHEERRAGSITAKRKDPSGGTTGRVKPYGRLGWMGARA